MVKNCFVVNYEKKGIIILYSYLSQYFKLLQYCKEIYIEEGEHLELNQLNIINPNGYFIT